MEIGPLDVNLNPRNKTWLQKANLLFIDNPVGSGFSYVTKKSALATTNKQIAVDLVTTLSSVFQQVTEFQKSPLYIFGESYGGKMTVDFAVELSKAIELKTITANFKGIALGDAWISPVDLVASWDDYLYATSLIDKNQHDNLQPLIKQMKKSISNGEFKRVTDLTFELQSLIENYTASVDFFNILEFYVSENENSLVNKFGNAHRLNKLFKSYVQPSNGDPLSELMNGKIRDKLRIPKNVTWGGQSADVFAALYEDFMKPVVSSVNNLLVNQTYLDVNIYNGQLDLLVNVIGTSQWIETLQWPGSEGFAKAARKTIVLPQNQIGGYVKSFKQFSMFWILKAGHMVPIYTPTTAFQMVDMILSKKK